MKVVNLRDMEIYEVDIVLDETEYWVSADVAQDLYDALQLIKDHPNARYEVEAQLGEEIWEALTKSDV